jgi:hypothetical protein
LFDVQLAVFKVNIHCHYADGKFKLYSQNTGNADEEEMDEEDDE